MRTVNAYNYKYTTHGHGRSATKFITKFMIQLQHYVTSCFTPTEQKIIVHSLLMKPLILIIITLLVFNVY